MRYILSIIFLFLVGCTNPFTTREPKPPDIINPIQPISNLQTNPDSLLRQLQYAFQEPDWNYYDALMVDFSQFGINFIFVPQQDAAFRLQNWTRDDEINYFRKLIKDRNRNDLLLQVYSIEGPVQIGASQDTLQIQFKYQIEIDMIINKEYYQGQSIFRIFRSPQALWYIYLWEDLQISADKTDSTWSILKATYR
ncbi:MAG: hypothetical protein KAJ16_13385 [Calditrichia bacterium]|nr:hypothetical protein [Calditrichia bacterium]MCK5455355.1 hypothetical protein [Calditrichia bacterium]